MLKVNTVIIMLQVWWLGICESKCQKRYLQTCTPSKDSNQPAQPHQNLHWAYLIASVAKFLCGQWQNIRQCRCTGWFESSLGAHVRSLRYIIYKHYCIYPKYSDTTTPYHICSKIWTSTIHYPMLCLKTAGWVANSVDPDETPRSVASHLGLNCLRRPVCPNICGKYGKWRIIVPL